MLLEPFHARNSGSKAKLPAIISISYSITADCDRDALTVDRYQRTARPAILELIHASTTLYIET